MICNFCKKEIPDDSLFCPECGSALGNAAPEIPDAPAAPEIPEIPEVPSYTYDDKTVEVSSAPAYSYNNETAEATPAPDQTPAYTEGQTSYEGSHSVPMYSYESAPEPKKNKKKLIVTAVAALLAVALVATVIFTGFFGLIALPGNLKTMHKSVVKTLKQDNFTVDITVKEGDNEQSGTLKVDMENTAFCFETGSDGRTQYIAFSDGKAYQMTEKNDGSAKGNVNEADTDDIEDIVEILPNIYSDLMLKGKINDDLKDMIDDAIDGNIPEQYEDYVEFVYFLCEDIVSIFNDQDWLEEYAEFKPSAKKGCRVYEITLTAENLTRGLARGLLSENFRDELIDGVVEAVYDELPSSVSDIIASTDVTIEITTKHNKLQEVNLSAESEGQSVSINFEFKDYNKTDVGDDINHISDKID